MLLLPIAVLPFSVDGGEMDAGLLRLAVVPEVVVEAEAEAGATAGEGAVGAFLLKNENKVF